MPSTDYLFHHMFILTDPGAPKANSLIEQGFIEGPSNTHPGQGTKNRRFFFENFMIEFLWIYDEEEAKNQTTKDTMIFERWSSRKEKCPYGFCIQPLKQNLVKPFHGWPYKPKYISPSQHILVANNWQNMNEPFLFMLPYFENKVDLSITNPFSLKNFKVKSAEKKPCSLELQNFCQISDISILCSDIFQCELSFTDGLNTSALKQIIL